jgi:hypothetical protein
MAFLHSGAMIVDVQFRVKVVEGRKELLISFSSLEYKKVEKMTANCNADKITEAHRPLKLSDSFLVYLAKYFDYSDKLSGSFSNCVGSRWWCLSLSILNSDISVLSPLGGHPEQTKWILEKSSTGFHP